MIALWQILVGNLAVVALVISTWTHVRDWVMRRSPLQRRMLFGLFMGVGAVSSMLMAFELRPGSFFDLRTSLLALSGFFGGPYSALISGSAALAYRIFVGGIGVWAGSQGIVLASLTGVLGFLVLRRRPPRRRHVLLLAVAVVCVNFIGFAALPADVVAEAFFTLGPPISLLSFVATVFSGFVFISNIRRAAERDLLVAALAQAPDFAYVKNLRSEFAAVNNAVAQLHGFARPAEMLGKTDFDIAQADRAAKLFAAEQKLMSSGDAHIESEEELPDRSGEMRWYATSKVTLHNDDGELIGMVGVTRDVTREKELRRELETNRNLLSYALTKMSDGLAMFDQAGNLVFSNEQYRRSFPLSGEIRQPGTNIHDILKFVANSGEQLTVPSEGRDAWIESTAALVHVESEEQVQLFNGRWLQLRTRPTGDGASMVVVSDVTELKQAELDLLEASTQLKLLASTDGLTGLLNRRAFDETIVQELKRSGRAKSPLSLLLIDVDHFKRYNDRYGHPAGDECLRVVSNCLTAALRRPADLAARYGGEEFAVILPDTDQDGAFSIADKFRKTILELGIAHDGNEIGVVTISVGIATNETSDFSRDPDRLIKEADEALYRAKAAGRNSVIRFDS